jgi:hypothetical protein
MKNASNSAHPSNALHYWWQYGEHWSNVSKNPSDFLWSFVIWLWLSGLIKSVQSFGKKIARKCLFCMQNHVRLKIPWDSSAIHGNCGFLLILRGKSRVFMGINYRVYHGLLGSQKGNDIYDGPPAPWFVSGTVLKRKEQYTQYGHGLNFSTTTLMAHFAGSKDPFYLR